MPDQDRTNGFVELDLDGMVRTHLESNLVAGEVTEPSPVS